MPNFLKADNRLTLLGESVANLLEILCLFGADGRPTLLEESIAEIWSYSAGSEGILVMFFSRTYLGTWWTEQLDRLDNSLLPLFLMSPVIIPLFCMQVFTS